MKKNKSLEWIGVFDEVNGFMERHLDKWNTIEEIRQTYDEFINNLKKIKDLQPELEQDLAPLKKELREKRERLSEKLFPVVNLFEVYAQDHPIGKKLRKIQLNQKDLESSGDQQLYQLAHSLHKLAVISLNRAEGMDKSKENKDKDITRYGLTQAMVDELYRAKYEFESILFLRTDVVSYRKKTQRKWKELIKENRILLKKRLNKLMSIFSGTHPSFYRDYCRASRQK